MGPARRLLFEIFSRPNAGRALCRVQHFVPTATPVEITATTLKELDVLDPCFKLDVSQRYFNTNCFWFQLK